MRERLQKKLDHLLGRLNELVSAVGVAMRHATTALLDADDQLAQQVVDADGFIVARQSQVDMIALDLLVRHRPVAADLRTIVACLRMSVDLRRMGKLAVHVAEIAHGYYPDRAVPAELWAVVSDMAEHAQRIVATAGRAVVDRDGTAVAALERDDDRLDRLQGQLYRRLFERPWSTDVESTVEHVVDVALLGRYYERYADHAVALGHHVAYVNGLETLDATSTG